MEVSVIWSEAVEKNLTNHLVAGARIDAAASMGDIEGAAEGLDFMITHDLDADTPAFTSAINACATAEPPSPSAAMYVYEQMLERDLRNFHEPCEGPLQGTMFQNRSPAVRDEEERDRPKQSIR